MPQVEPEIGQLLDTNLFRGSLFRFHAKLWGWHSAEVQFLAASLKLLMGQTDQSGSTTALPYERSPQSVPSLLDLGLLLLHFRRTLQHGPTKDTILTSQWLKAVAALHNPKIRRFLREKSKSQVPSRPKFRKVGKPERKEERGKSPKAAKG